MAYTQDNRLMAVSTPLGKDALLLVGFAGEEAISRPFHFDLELIAENDREIAFDKLLGQKLSVVLTLPDERKRYFDGICRRVIQGERDKDFTAYRVEMVPRLWLLSRKVQSRIFQQLAVPDILKKVLTDIDVTFEIHGTFEPRDYCVQYRESDLDFASRLMEEEGIYYFFKHGESGHKLVIANSPQSHPDVPDHAELIFDVATGGTRDDERVYDWQKGQELRSGKVTLWDYCFEMPTKHLEAERTALDTVQIGKATHRLKVGGNEKLEIYDFPGEYAQRFDGVDRGGGDRASDLQKIFQDNRRTVEIRMQQEEVSGLTIRGVSTCFHLVSGHKFALTRHFNADGKYVLVGVRHVASFSGDYRSGSAGEYKYENQFSCIPLEVPFRPQRVTVKPTVRGSQTARVVGPSGDEIFTDKYGRVKVQFPWDREGKSDAESSCWIRAGTVWAGQQWAAIHIPRVGQEVIVDFLEGDPDQPIIVGTVYNADNMPPYKLPAKKTRSGIKSRSTKGGSASTFNEIRFEDASGSEQVLVRAEKDLDVYVKDTRRESVQQDRHLTVGGTRNESVTQDYFVKVGQKIVIDAGMELTISGPGGFIKLDAMGITIQGTLVNINSGGAPGIITMPPEEADDGSE